ncbi:Cysteamine dioxygenase [Zostera marina]|uniref:cysteine dioxygenase n=1 Tax=Zostera marina TaxID=29655 RepID=A0A0K9P6G1_ZOSMR|nr:Cysteamine dioxygenase [Zostera marina]
MRIGNDELKLKPVTFEGGSGGGVGGGVGGNKSRRRKKTRQHKKQKKTAVRTLFLACEDVFSTDDPETPLSPDKVAKIRSRLDVMKPEDLNLSPSLPYFGNPIHETHTNSAVTYIHLFESDHFSIGIFCLPAGSVIPLHNHPRMTVFSKLLFGSMHIKSYDWTVADDSKPHLEAPRSPLRLAKVKTNAVFTAPCDTSILYPTTGGNMHCFTAMTPCAVIDVLGPPYSDYEGRHCAYYNPFPYIPAEVNNNKEKSVDEYALLQEIEKPDGFSVHGAIYNGPSIFHD